MRGSLRRSASAPAPATIAVALTIALVLVLCLAPPASGGRNTNGAMVVHTNDSADYYSTSPEFCGYGVPSTCADLNPNGARDENQIIWLLAAFPPGSYPGVTEIRFGIRHSFTGEFIDHAPCGPGVMEDPGTNWPNGSGGSAGDRVSFSAPVYDPLIVFYWFAVSLAGSDPAQRFLGTAFDPATGDAEFLDDSTPPSVDRCYNFGTVRWDGAGWNACPVALPTGVCCLMDHTCIITTELDCNHLAGIFRADGTTCNPNPCLSPTGACCFEDGACSEVTQEDCASFSCTTYQGDFTTCAGASCTPRIGACCFTDGSCVMGTVSQCNDFDGRWDCTLICDPNPCPHWGACCLPSLRCEFETAAQCAAAGGTYQGDGTACDPPDLCGAGACCLPNLNCELSNSIGCAVLGGVYQGDGTNCDQAHCYIGACCLPDLTCQVVSFFQCAGYAGTWRGYENFCPPDPPCDWESQFGTCCIPQAGCVMCTESQCDENYGNWYGLGQQPCVPCVLPATKKTTWGQIKTLFR